MKIIGIGLILLGLILLIYLGVAGIYAQAWGDLVPELLISVLIIAQGVALLYA